MLVEFLGAPGSGKSTLAAGLAQALRQGDRRVAFETMRPAARRDRAALRHARTFLRHTARSPRFALTAWAAALRWRPGLRDAARLALSAQEAHLAAAAGADFRILEQGLAQTAWALAFWSRRPCRAEPLARYLAAAPPPGRHCVVLVRCTAATLQRRARGRRSSHNLDDAGAAARAVEALQCVEVALGMLRPGATRLITVDGEQQPEQAVTALARALTEQP